MSAILQQLLLFQISGFSNVMYHFIYSVTEATHNDKVKYNHWNLFSSEIVTAKLYQTVIIEQQLVYYKKTVI